MRPWSWACSCRSASGRAFASSGPHRAQGWARGLALVSTVGFIGVVGLILWRDMADVINAWDHLVPVVAMATVVVALFAGWAVGGPTRESRLSASLVTSVRSNTPALAVASATYGATSDAASAIVVFALTSLTISGFVAIWLRSHNVTPTRLSR